MTRTRQLEGLFKKWENKEGYFEHFKRDGIIDELRYEKAPRKVLFIAKEANAQGETRRGDFRSWWRDEPITGSFSFRLCEWSYGLLNGFCDHEHIDRAEADEALRSVAFMNLNKLGGGAVANHKILLEVIQEDAELIREQIAIMAPDVIVGCFYKSQYWKIIYPKVKWRTKDRVGVATYNGKTMIDYYHPANRGSNAMNYVMLRSTVAGLFDS